MNTHFDYSFSDRFYSGRKFTTADEAAAAAKQAADNAYPPKTSVGVFIAKIFDSKLELERRFTHHTPSADPIGKEAEHTSGPWYHMGAGNIMDSPTEGGSLLAIVKGKAHSDEWLQNVRLVVAAPEMLKALRVVCEHPYPWAFVEARKAIDRAVKGVDVTIQTELAAAITSLRKRVTRAQEEGVNLYRRLGYSEAEIEEDRPTWAVIVQSGDILRILDALEKTK